MEERVDVHVQRSQYQGNCAEQLDQNVKRWACRVLEGIANGVADHACLVRFALLTLDGASSVEAINHFALGVGAQVASLNVLLGIVPRATAIVEEGCQDDTTH